MQTASQVHDLIVEIIQFLAVKILTAFLPLVEPNANQLHLAFDT